MEPAEGIKHVYSCYPAGGTLLVYPASALRALASGFPTYDAVLRQYNVPISPDLILRLLAL